ncbi:hypothetical protein VTJ83DRAFT_3701 [Remersonia thermophila]|uniref:Laccase n=1 Tax=Remersonia thermophila TaxID=72144 RepID=A0ABR4DEW5_9PEZI
MSLLDNVSNLLGTTINHVAYTAKASLSQQRTNGLALWGTLLNPMLPNFLTNNPLPNGFPWDRRTDRNTNQYKDTPRTGVTRRYDWTISRGRIAPDGYERDVLLVNGQFPGPLIEANWGDRIVVDVKNNITNPDEGTAIHWHGFLQTHTPWEDGAPGITQCPIPPKQSYRYDFIADMYGSTWYHAHYSSQYTGGLIGPIVVHGPTSQRYDIDVGPILLHDWHHKEYFQIVKEMLTPNGGGGATRSDNNLINGKNHFDCSTVAEGDKTPCTNEAGISKFKFRAGKTHRLRLINAGGDGVQRFSIDEHTMTVIAEDFVPVRPYQTRIVTLGVGQRADVLVRADHPLGAERKVRGGPTTVSKDAGFWIRSNITCTGAGQPNALAVVYYEGADVNRSPKSRAWDSSGATACANDNLGTSEPLYPIPAPRPSVTHTMAIQVGRNASGITQWSFGGVAARVHFNQPALLEVNEGKQTFDEGWNVLNFGRNQSVRIIVNNTGGAAHPMHLHGHNMQILAVAPNTAPWDGVIVRPQNPTRRDVFIVPGRSLLVIQFDPEPGAWAWHCHIAWHAAAGFLSTLVTHPDQIRRMNIPRHVENNCKAWDAYTAKNVVDHIDSGA